MLPAEIACSSGRRVAAPDCGFCATLWVQPTYLKYLGKAALKTPAVGQGTCHGKTRVRLSAGAPANGTGYTSGAISGSTGVAPSWSGQGAALPCPACRAVLVLRAWHASQPQASGQEDVDSNRSCHNRCQCQRGCSNPGCCTVPSIGRPHWGGYSHPSLAVSETGCRPIAVNLMPSDGSDKLHRAVYMCGVHQACAPTVHIYDVAGHHD